MDPKLASPAKALRAAAKHGDMREVRWLVGQGVDVNVWEENGYTALTNAAHAGHTEIVRFLLRNGAWADPHEDCAPYFTPLAEAARRGHLAIVKMLIEAGANPTWQVGPSQMTAENYARGSQPEVRAYLVKVIEQMEKKQRRKK